jgi:hypothetical protein
LIFKKKRFVIAPALFQTSATFRTRDLRKARRMVQLPIGIRSVRERYQESSLPKMRGDDGIAAHRA